MTAVASALLADAERLWQEELGRRSGRLGRLDPEARREVEAACRALGEGVARCLLEHAAHEPALRMALFSLYGPQVRGARP
jgi:hypothetical protein